MHFLGPKSSTRFWTEKSSFQELSKSTFGAQGGPKREPKGAGAGDFGLPGGMRRPLGRDLGRGQVLGRSLRDKSRPPAEGAADRFAHSAGPYHLTCGVGWLVGCLVGWLVGVGWVGWLVGWLVGCFVGWLVGFGWVGGLVGNLTNSQEHILKLRKITSQLPKITTQWSKNDLKMSLGSPPEAPPTDP